MKKAIALLAVLMLSTVAFAGPYFSVENDGVAIAPVFTGGVDFSVLVQTGPRIFGDVNFVLPTNDLNASMGVGLAGAEVELATLLDFNRRLNILNGWDTSFVLTGYPFIGVKVWGGLSFNYDPTPPHHTPAWTLVPVFGIEGRW